MTDQASFPLHRVPPCENCGTPRRGPYCHRCGQHEDTAHHSVRRLFIEAAEHLLNTDGKIFRTLRGIMFSPAELTRNYLAGKRAAQLPPLQLYFVMLVLFLFIGDEEVTVETSTLTPAQAAQLPHWIKWIIPVGQRIHAHGSSFLGLLHESAEFFGLLMVPVAALIFWGLYARRPLYDHLVFTLHSLSFVLIVLDVLLLLSNVPDSPVVPLLVLALMLLATHLFMHLRGCYGGGIVATLARMTLLVLGTMTAYIVLSIIWLATTYFVMTL